MSDSSVAPQTNNTWWTSLSLKTKTTMVLIGFSVLSTVGSALTYSFANRVITQQIITAKQETTQQVADKVAFFLRERFGDIQIMSNLAIFTNSELRNSTSSRDKQTALNSFIQAYTVYDSVAAFDLQGEVIAQSTGKPLGNRKSRSYFQQALEVNAPIISQPLYSQDTNAVAVYLATPIKDSISGENIGVIRARMPVKYLRDLILAVDAEHNYLVDNSGRIFVASDAEEFEEIQAVKGMVQPARERFKFLGEELANEARTIITEAQLVSYVPFINFEDEFRARLPDLGWSTVTTIDKDIAFAPRRQLMLGFTISTLAVAAIITAIAAVIGERVSRQLAEKASVRSPEIDCTLSNLDDSVQKIADYAREAARINHLGMLQAREGDCDIEQTVNSIEKIRITVATTAKKVKQLAESSQEVVRVDDIVAEISEKANLLAFNAEVEAERAGKYGEGFKVVAEEIRRLADRTTEATNEIERLISKIQIDTTAVLRGIEAGTTEVVAGSKSIYKIQETIKDLVYTSVKIDEYFQSISIRTKEQTN